jgi:hypothetical protein
MSPDVTVFAFFSHASATYIESPQQHPRILAVAPAFILDIDPKRTSTMRPDLLLEMQARFTSDVLTCYLGEETPHGKILGNGHRVARP